MLRHPTLFLHTELFNLSYNNLVFIDLHLLWQVFDHRDVVSFAFNPGNLTPHVPFHRHAIQMNEWDQNKTWHIASGQWIFGYWLCLYLWLHRVPCWNLTPQEHFNPCFRCKDSVGCRFLCCIFSAPQPWKPYLKKCRQCSAGWKDAVFAY